MTLNHSGVSQSVALKTAWRLYAQLQENATAVFKKYLSLQSLLTGLFVTATLLAILTCSVGSGPKTLLLSEALRTCLVIVTIGGVLVFVQVNRLQQGQYWLILQGGAAEAGKAIYWYRTLLQCEQERHQWLDARIADIQRQVFETIGGDWVLTPYTGELPIGDSPVSQTSDPGFSDLLADDYLQYRLTPQVDWHRQELAKLNTSHTRLRIGIFGLGGLSALAPALGGDFSIWVAFTTALGFALMVWLEVCRLDGLIQTTNQLILELTIIQTHWQSLNAEERTGKAFFQLAIATEEVLWNFYSQPSTAMRQVVAAFKGQTDDLLTRVMIKPVPIEIDRLCSCGMRLKL